jgi:RNA polymerase sigma-70 factor (ECF subfamily)
LSRYCPFHAARADLLARSGAIDEALGTYDTAIALAPSPADARLLQDKRDELASFAARMGKKKAETSSAKSNREV